MTVSVSLRQNKLRVDTPWAFTDPFTVAPVEEIDDALEVVTVGAEEATNDFTSPLLVAPLPVARTW